MSASNPNAFPFGFWDQGESGSAIPTRDQEGMTLMDYFAAKALQGIMANGDIVPNAGERWTESVIRKSWELAKLMIKARPPQ